MGSIRKISIALTEELVAQIDAAVASGDYASTSEVVRDALRGWSRERLEADRLRRLWEEGLGSGEPRPVTDEWFETIRRRGAERAARLRGAR